MHLAGRPHQNRAESLGVDPLVDPDEPTDTPGTRYCDICATGVPNVAWKRHLNGPRHAQKERFMAFKAAFAEGEKDKNGVTVSHSEGGIDFGVIRPNDARVGVRLSVTLSSTVPSANIILKDFQLGSRPRGTNVSP
jgi:helicase MOV-10